MDKNQNECINKCEKYDKPKFYATCELCNNLFCNNCMYLYCSVCNIYCYCFWCGYDSNYADKKNRYVAECIKHKNNSSKL